MVAPDWSSPLFYVFCTQFQFFFSEMFLLITFFYFTHFFYFNLDRFERRNLLNLLLPENLLVTFIWKINCYKYWIHNSNDNKIIIISIIITAPYSTVLKRKFQTTASSTNHHLEYPVMQNPVNSPGSIFKTSPYQAETELDVKDTLFEI